MQYKTIHSDEHARNELHSSINILANVVGDTMGPHGRTVIIESDVPGVGHVITKDGVTVAAELNFKDPIKNVGVQLIKKVAGRVNAEAGDGTTTATVFAAGLFNQGIKFINNLRNNYVKPDEGNLLNFIDGINEAKDDLLALIKKESIKLINSDGSIDYEKLRQVSMISTNGDESLTNLIIDAFTHVGNDGMVIVEEGFTGNSVNVKLEGMTLTRGMESKRYATNTTGTFEAKDVLYVISQDIIDESTNYETYLTLLVNVIRSNDNGGKQRGLVFIAADFTEEVRTKFINLIHQFHNIHNVSLCLVKAPEYGDHRTDVLEDIATATGTLVINGHGLINQGFHNAENISIVVGSSDRVTINHNTTTIIGYHGNPDAIKERVKGLREERDTVNENVEPVRYQRLSTRIAKLTSGVVNVRIGGNSDLEVKETLARAVDAQCAVKSALEEGFLPGAGMFLANFGYSKKTSSNPKNVLGYEAFKKAVLSPVLKLLDNSMANDSQVEVVKQLLEEFNGDYSMLKGYNFKTMEVVTLIDNGIVDPAKVTRCVIEYGTSIVSLLLKTNNILLLDNVHHWGNINS